VSTGRSASRFAIPARGLAQPPDRSVFGDLVILVFLSVQALDGVLTYVGMVVTGVGEGNPIVHHSMQAIGMGGGLAAAKLVAAGCAILLHVLAFHRMLALLTIVYIACAILPWTWVLLN
jgi:hypothetical protein